MNMMLFVRNKTCCVRLGMRIGHVGLHGSTAKPKTCHTFSQVEKV